LKEFTGKPSGVLRPFMGIVATNPSAWFIGRQKVLLIRSQNDIRKFFSWFGSRRRTIAFIVSENVNTSIPKDIPCVFDVPASSCSTLNEGDIVLIEHTGKVTRLYEAGSPHNSIFVTNRCNCSCIMCPQPPSNDPENLLERNLMLISLLDQTKTKQLGITGGEPTLLGEDLVKIIQACRKRLPNTLLTLLTNAIKLKDLEFARALVLSGLPRMVVEIALYGDNDTEHDSITGVKGSFYKTLEGLYNLALLGQPVGLRTVLHAMTIERLTQYSEFIYRNLTFVVNVAFMGMETTGLASSNLDRLWVDPYEYREQLATAVKHLTRRQVPVSIYNHQLCILPYNLWPLARRSITSWKVTYLPLCEECGVKDSCCGFFSTSERHSAFIRPVTVYPRT